MEIDNGINIDSLKGIDDNISMTDESLQLFIRYTCPFCIRVLHFLDQYGISVTLRDISANPDDATQLQEKGGKVQVPCLMDGDFVLYESLDIINWFKHNRSQ